MKNSETFICRDCHEKFDVSESVKDASRKRGIMERCKPCDRKRKKDHRTDNEDQRIKVRDANRALRKERKEAGYHWSDTFTDDQVADKRAYSRKYSRERRWAEIGATPQDYQWLFMVQGGRCAMCRTNTPQRGANRVDEFFCIDHDHETGELRGLLCSHCNLVIGHAFDSIERLQSGIDYLERWGK